MLGGEDLSSWERWFLWLALLTPLWWLLGVQVVLYPLLICALLGAAVWHYGPSRPLPRSAWGWLAMGLVMASTAFVGLGSVGFEPIKVAGQILAFLKGYFLIFACLALPFYYRLRVAVLRRIAVLLGILYLLTIVLYLGLYLGGFRPIGFSPIFASLTGSDALSVRVDIGMGSQAFFGVYLPRTVLFTADPPILGVSSLLLLCMVATEPDRYLRRAALAGVFAALLFSFSRASWLCLPLIGAVVLGMRSGWFSRLMLWLGAGVSLVCGLASLAPAELLGGSLDLFNSARSSSSQDRNRVIEKTLEAWQESPWIGWGVIQGSVHWHIYDIALGSFSTYAAVLYLHGVVGFVALVTAMALTLWDSFTAAATTPEAIWACAALLSLYFTCAAEPLTWMTPVLWWFFLWVGAVLYEHAERRDRIRPIHLSQSPT